VLAPDGYLRVNYARLGLSLMTWDEWNTVAAIAQQRVAPH